MADRKQRIIMIGCGTYAQDNHLPVLRQFREEVELVAVLVGQAQQISVGAALRRAGFDSDFARDFARNVIFAPHEGKLPIDALDTRIAELEREGRKPDGAIVSTISALNYDAVRWCLENRLHVLVEKPATCPSNCAWDREKALQISSQLEALVALANESGLRFLVGAQRRYEDVFKRVRDLDQGIEAIQVTHTLGWKLAARDSALPGKRFDNWRGDPSLSGGKIMHSGSLASKLAV